MTKVLEHLSFHNRGSNGALLPNKNPNEWLMGPPAKMVLGGNHVLLVAVTAALMMSLVPDASAEDVACIVDDQG